jgi:hypothetical protein
MESRFYLMHNSAAVSRLDNQWKLKNLPSAWHLDLVFAVM